jgi:uncharacterized protein YndB with AHSA1/START domain
MAQFHIDRLFQADVEKVWQFLTDFEGRKSTAMKVKVIESGNPENHQVGLVREIQMNGLTVRERILRVIPNESIEYELIKGAPVYDYFGTIFVYPERDGTTVRWVGTFKSKFPWPEWLVKKRAMRFIEGILKDMEKAVQG